MTGPGKKLELAAQQMGQIMADAVFDEMHRPGRFARLVESRDSAAEARVAARYVSLSDATCVAEEIARTIVLLCGGTMFIGVIPADPAFGLSIPSVRLRIAYRGDMPTPGERYDDITNCVFYHVRWVDQAEHWAVGDVLSYAGNEWRKT